MNFEETLLTLRAADTMRGMERDFWERVFLVAFPSCGDTVESAIQNTADWADKSLVEWQKRLAGLLWLAAATPRWKGRAK